MQEGYDRTEHGEEMQEGNDRRTEHVDEIQEGNVIIGLGMLKR